MVNPGSKGSSNITCKIQDPLLEMRGDTMLPKTNHHQTLHCTSGIQSRHCLVAMIQKYWSNEEADPLTKEYSAVYFVMENLGKQFYKRMEHKITQFILKKRPKAATQFIKWYNKNLFPRDCRPPMRIERYLCSLPFVN